MLKPLIAFLLLHVTQATALAAPPGGSATLEWAHEARHKIVLEDVVWNCAGNGCRGALKNSGTRAVARYCRILARYGKVTNFTTAAGPLDEAGLSRCNGRRAA